MTFFPSTPFSLPTPTPQLLAIYLCIAACVPVLAFVLHHRRSRTTVISPPLATQTQKCVATEETTGVATTETAKETETVTVVDTTSAVQSLDKHNGHTTDAERNEPLSEPSDSSAATTDASEDDECEVLPSNANPTVAETTAAPAPAPAPLPFTSSLLASIAAAKESAALTSVSSADQKPRRRRRSRSRKATRESIASSSAKPTRTHRRRAPPAKRTTPVAAM